MQTNRFTFRKAPFSVITCQSIHYLCRVKLSRPNFGQFNNTTNWTRITAILRNMSDVNSPPTSPDFKAEFAQWHDYLFAKHTKNSKMSIKTSCDLPDGF